MKLNIQSMHTPGLLLATNLVQLANSIAHARSLVAAAYSHAREIATAEANHEAADFCGDPYAHNCGRPHCRPSDSYTGPQPPLVRRFFEVDAIAEAAPPASEQQHDGRMPSDSRNRMWELIDAALLGTVPDGLKRGDICNILAPLFASEQQRAEADLLNMIDQHRIELLPEYDAGYTAIAYCAQTEPIAEAVAMTARAALEELAKKLQSAAPPQENDR